MDIKTAPIGHEFTQAELRRQCKAIYGGVSWPGQRPGFAAVLGMSHDRHFDNYDIVLLDEFESVDVRELVRQCGALDYKYEPKVWYGDRLNDAADRFIYEMSSEPNDVEGRRRYFHVCSTWILDMKCPYQYILAELRQLLNRDRRQLFLKDSRVRDYLDGIEPQEIAELEFGEFPVIEALAFAVLEMRRHGSQMAKRKRPDRYEPKRRKPGFMAG